SELVMKIIERKFIRETVTKNDVEAVSANLIFSLSSASGFGILKRIVNAIGTEKLSDTFEEIQSTHEFNSIFLTVTGIKLDHYTKFPLKQIESFRRLNEKNPLAFSILQSFVIDYLYMYEVKFERKQQICNLLNIKMEEQRFIADTSLVKR
ncbi:MAG: hypothetical protein WCF67_12175, partial [Chitinophagaceae bacterium]